MRVLVIFKVCRVEYGVQLSKLLQFVRFNPMGTILIFSVYWLKTASLFCVFQVNLNFEFCIEKVFGKIIESQIPNFWGVAKQIKGGPTSSAGFDQKKFSDGSQLFLELVVPLKTLPHFQHCSGHIYEKNQLRFTAIPTD